MLSLSREPPTVTVCSFFPSSSPVTIRSVLEFTSAGNPDTFPFRKKQLKESTPGTPALSQIRTLAFRRAAGLGERLLLLAQDLPSEVTEENTIPTYKKRFRYERCGVVSVSMPFMWSSCPRALKGRVEMA